MVDWLEIADEEDVDFRVVPLEVVVWLSITDEEGIEFKVELSKPVDVCEPREVLAWDGEFVVIFIALLHITSCSTYIVQSWTYVIQIRRFRLKICLQTAQVLGSAFAI